MLGTMRTALWSASLAIWLEVWMEGSGESSRSCTLVLGLTLVVVGTRVTISAATSWWMRSTMGLGWTVVVASWISLRLTTVETWVEPSTEQLMGALTMQAVDASQMTSRTSVDLVVEEGTSGTGAGEASVVVEAARSTSEVTTGGSPTRAIPNAEHISSA